MSNKKIRVGDRVTWGPKKGVVTIILGSMASVLFDKRSSTVQLDDCTLIEPEPEPMPGGAAMTFIEMRVGDVYRLVGDGEIARHVFVLLEVEGRWRLYKNLTTGVMRDTYEWALMDSDVVVMNRTWRAKKIG